MVSGDEILWMYVGNHGTARNTPNSTEKSTEYRFAYGKNGKTKEVGCFGRPIDTFSGIRVQAMRDSVPFKSKP